MVGGSSARGREGLERHQWVVEGELYRTFVIFGRRSDYSGVIVQALPKLSLSIKDWRSAPFARGCGSTLVNQHIEERHIGSYWLAVVKGEDIVRLISPVTRLEQVGC